MSVPLQIDLTLRPRARCDIIDVTEFIEDLVARYGVAKGRVDIALDPEERNAALVVNEHETLLMRHDLAEVLRDPLKFAVRDHDEPGRGTLVRGRYQSPILLQWSASPERHRVLCLSLRSFA